MKHTAQSKKRPGTDSQNIDVDAILAFTERPRVEPADGQRKRVGAHDLFSLFTADIIKEKTLFTR